MQMNIFKAMKPDAVYKKVTDIPFEQYASKGVNCVLFDFDNTIGPDHATEPNEYSFECIKKASDLGMESCLVSNAKSGRSSGIAGKLGIKCVTYAHKPRPDGINRALELMGRTKEETIFIGDQIFTDVMAGRFAGVHTIMVEPYAKKEVWYIVLKRFFEKIVRLFGRF